MALLEQTKSSIRRHLKYGNIGLSVSVAGGGTLGANSGWRYFREWGELEVRMNSMQPVDEAALLGLPYAVLVLQGMDPRPGDQLSFQISGGGLSSAQTITVTAAGETRDQFALRVASACAQNANVNAAQIIALSPMGGGRSGVQNPLSEVQFLGQSAFTISNLTMTGNIGAALRPNGSLPDVVQTIGGINFCGFLPICNELFRLITTASDRMGVDKADVFTARKSELSERQKLYMLAVNNMADFLVVPTNPDASSGQRSNIGCM